MRKMLAIILALVLMLAMTVPAFAENDEPVPPGHGIPEGDLTLRYDSLWAGKIWQGKTEWTIAGHMWAWQDGSDLHILYHLEWGWEMTEAHVAIGEDLLAIPHNGAMNVVPGKFDKVDNGQAASFDPSVHYSEFVFDLEALRLDTVLGAGGDIIIAAHAVVQLLDGGEVIQEETAWGGCNPLVYDPAARLAAKTSPKGWKWAHYMVYLGDPDGSGMYIPLAPV